MTKPGRPAHPDILTPREQEVLALLREGLTNPQIAERMSITLDGAKYHVAEILSKLGVSSREEAARWDATKRPWWATAAAPLGWAWQKANISWLATGVAGITAVLVVAGVALLVWGLVRTDGGADANDATSVLAEPTLVVASPTVSPPTPAPTAEATPAQTTALPTSTTEPVVLSPAPTQIPGVTPDLGCATEGHSHVNIEKLRLQPSLINAVITEYDDGAVLVILEGIEFLVQGRGKVVGIGEPRGVDSELSARVGGAVDAVRYEC